jgi:hypothetical protein
MLRKTSMARGSRVLRMSSMARESRMHTHRSISMTRASSMLGKSSMARASSMLHLVLYFVTLFIKNICNNKFFLRNSFIRIT